MPTSRQLQLKRQWPFLQLALSVTPLRDDPSVLTQLEEACLSTPTASDRESQLFHWCLQKLNVDRKQLTVSSSLHQLHDDLCLMSAAPSPHLDTLTCSVVHKYGDISFERLASRFDIHVNTLRKRLKQLTLPPSPPKEFSDIQDSLRIKLLRAVSNELLLLPVLENDSNSCHRILQEMKDLHALALLHCPELALTVTSSWAICLFLYCQNVDRNISQLTTAEFLMQHMMENYPNLSPLCITHLNARYLRLRLNPNATPHDWMAFNSATGDKQKGSRYIFVVEGMKGWKAAMDYIENGIGPREDHSLNNSWSTKFLYSHYALKNQQPRLASRYLKQVARLSLPPYWQQRVERRLAFANLHHQGGDFHYDEPDGMIW